MYNVRKIIVIIQNYFIHVSVKKRKKEKETAKKKRSWHGHTMTPENERGTLWHVHTYYPEFSPSMSCPGMYVHATWWQGVNQHI